jgi:hypothetical protein
MLQQRKKRKKVTSGHASTDPKLEMNLKNVYNPIRKNHYKRIITTASCTSTAGEERKQTFSD